MPDLTSDQDEAQDKPDPNIYQPEEGEEDESEIDRRIRRTHERLRRLTIVGAPDFNTEAGCLDVLTVEGGFDTGYAVQYQDCASGATSAVIGTGACCFSDGSCVVETEAQCLMNHGIYLGDGTNCGPPNPCIAYITGACCFEDGTCEIETEAACNADGGDYQGNGTSCTPNPCVGACCFPDGTCSLETSDACMNAGGTFQGIGTDCDPNPCTLPTCCPNAFFHDGNYYLTKQVCVTGLASYAECRAGPCDANCNFCATVTIDPNTCVQTVGCTGTSFDESTGFSQTWTLGLSGGHCCWFEGGVFTGSCATTGNVGNCGECTPVPHCPADAGFIDELHTDCSGTCTEPVPSPCDPAECCGTRSFTVATMYSNQCTPPP